MACSAATVQQSEKKNAPPTFKMSVNMYPTTQHHIPEFRSQPHCCENLKSYKVIHNLRFS
jgi:hypothetical protein